MSKVSAEELDAFFLSVFPDRHAEMPTYTLIENDRAVLSMEITKNNLRPGGYISGPTQMALADHAAYVATFTRIGIVPMAVTSNLSIDFLRPCIGTVLIADARLIKIGRTLSVSTVDMFAEGNEKISSRASVTYAIPQTK